MPAASTSSSWDFTAVIDLLHSPLEATIGAPIKPSVRSDISDSTRSTKPKDVPRYDADHHRLGDFSALWDTLSQSSISRASPDNTSNKIVSEQYLTATSILKRPSKSKTNKTKKQSNQLCRDPIPGALSDSTTGAESDGDLSVFDSPVPHSSILSFVPSQLGAVEKHGSGLTPPSSCEEDNTPSLKNFVKVQVEETATKYNSSAERKAGLVLKLAKLFPSFAGRSPATRKSADATSQVHIFVDSSNISIGFHDSYKIQHDIPVTTHIRRLPLSFHNFSLILERGRLAAKRVVVGSDRFPAINEAEKIGYEVNILDRVHKAKQFTPRQLKYRNALGPGPYGCSEMGTSPQERWVEQGVDEILHLKMLESLVDTDEPATIVLATGDAAEAEYSGGFLKMVERALQKGWTVEVVSFAANTSYAYKRKEFRAKWGSRFKLINLEEYVEELLDI